MKKSSFIFILIGALIISAVVFNLSFSIWKIFEICIGVFLIIGGVVPEKKGINFHTHKNLTTDEEREIVINEINDEMEKIESSDAKEYEKKIARGTMKLVEKAVMKETFTFNLKKYVRNFITYVLSGSVLIIDGIGLFGLKLSFGQILITFVASYMIGYGVSYYIRSEGEVK